MAEKIKVGVLHDMSDEPVGSDVVEWLRTEIDVVRAQGRLDVDIEYVEAFGLGLPAGTEEAVKRAFDELVSQGVVLIVGPAIGDNALSATPWVEEARIPTINWAGAERARGEYMFHLQVGSHEDESLVIARHLKAVGAKRIGVVYDLSPIGTRHLEYLEDEARMIGIEIVAAESISPLAEDASAEVDKVLASNPDGFCYLGLGLSTPAVAKALTARGWQGPRIMNTAGLRGYHGDFGRSCDGWIYVDMHSDGNRYLAELCERTGSPRDRAVWVAIRHDIARLAAEGLARAREYTPDGIKWGLEQIKWLPAAEGEDGTLLGFGVQDRGALHGRYLVLRQWLDGKTVEVILP